MTVSAINFTLEQKTRVCSGKREESGDGEKIVMIKDLVVRVAYHK